MSAQRMAKPRNGQRAAMLEDAGARDLVSRLRSATPEQIDAFVDERVTSLAAARALFKTILKILAVR